MKPSGTGETVSMREIEQKFEVPEDFELPSFDTVLGVAKVSAPVEHNLDAIYYDTPDLRLAASNLVLRRRAGGDDAGWHLKESVGDGERLETHAPLGAVGDGVPEELARLVRSRARRRSLVPIAKLESRRVLHRLVGADDDVLAEVADDHVTGTALLHPDPAVTSWREVEVELVDGDRDILTAAAHRLEDAGAEPARWGSKLGHALGDIDLAPAPVELDHRSTAREVVAAHLADQVGRLVSLDPHVRRDDEDAVHQMRVATRRLRSALATFRRLVDRAVTEPLRDELKWLGGELGAARDTEVIHQRLQEMVAAEPPALVHGPVAQRIDTTMSQRYADARSALLATLDSDRYLQLLDDLDAVASGAVIVGDRADKKATKVLPRELRRAKRRWQRDVDALDDAEDTDVQLHEVRKKAKRVRYAGEAVAPALGNKPKKLAARMEELQDVLGRHQDGIVTARVLEQLADDARAAGEDTFTYGRLHAIEQRAAADAAAEGRSRLV